MVRKTISFITGLWVYVKSFWHLGDGFGAYKIQLETQKQVAQEFLELYNETIEELRAVIDENIALEKRIKELEKTDVA